MIKIKIGFTGTQNGMTLRQKQEVTSIFGDEPSSEIHHGDCIGADEEAHEIAIGEGLDVIIHPPLDEKKRAFCRHYKELRQAKPYLERNHDIVDETDMLVAAPSGSEVVRSGTWATIRYALKIGKRVEIVMPDGSAGT